LWTLSAALTVAGAGAVACTTGAPSPERHAPVEAPRAPSLHVPRPGEEVVSRDLDGDGAVDAWSYAVTAPAGGLLVVRRERDLDGDGRTDLWEELEGGRVAVRTLDLDGDGRPDLVLRYGERGDLVVKEYAFGPDGRPHARALYEHGELVRRERDLGSSPQK
jgi:hypothetical protein